MPTAIQSIVRTALQEDVGHGDATTRALVPTKARTRAAIVARHACVVCGTAVAREVFRQVDPRIRCVAKRRDGAEAATGDTLILLEGPARGILTAERVALNFMQRMTGIATLTREFVRRAAPLGAEILDTRKTTPGLRTLEKYAVKCGGGANHRFGLFDRVLIKDNHRALWAGRGRKSLADAVRAARARHPRLAVEIEVESEAELRDALDARPDWVLLDNMTPALLRRCVKLNAGRAKIEASGGVSLATVARIAATGVDAISVGVLTHSAPAADLSLEFL